MLARERKIRKVIEFVRKVLSKECKVFFCKETQALCSLANEKKCSHLIPVNVNHIETG